MFRLHFGYLASGIATGLLLVFNFLWSLPDGKLHMTVCAVGQGDAVYIRFPDGRDMLIDGGPDASVLKCLGSHMPFWDRALDIVVLTHPEKDHLQGLIPVLERYRVGYIVRSDITNSSEGFSRFLSLVRAKRIAERLVVSGDGIRVGSVDLAVLWPSAGQVAMMQPSSGDGAVLGAQSSSVQRNDGSVVLRLRYGTYDAVFPGDADYHVASQYAESAVSDDTVELLKVPHHGSKTGMTPEYLDVLKPKLAVISVGKNTYGHPAPEILRMLADHMVRVLRTDQSGDIAIISDGKDWRVQEGNR